MTEQTDKLEREYGRLKHARAVWIATGYLKKMILDLTRPEFSENEGYNQALWDVISILNVYEVQSIERDLRDHIRDINTKKVKKP